MRKILGQPVRRIVLPLGWDWQERSLQGEYVCFSYLGNYRFENCLQKRGIPTPKPPSLSPVLKTQNSQISSSVPFSVLCFFPFSAKAAYISLLCIACRLFSLYKGSVAEEALIMWDAQFLLVHLPSAGREFCMGGCRCKLKKVGRWWRNRRMWMWMEELGCWTFLALQHKIIIDESFTPQKICFELGAHGLFPLACILTAVEKCSLF